jgi:glycosyltransferase involved in cell wall biosynthesis
MVTILVISNLYPPHYIGGYELGCRDVVEALKGRGHDVRVLTSTYGVAERQVDGEVYRWLEADFETKPRGRVGSAAHLLRKELTNRAAFERALRACRPQLIYVWNPVSISLALALYAENTGLPVCYFVSDGWLARSPQEDRWLGFWADESPGGLKRLTKWPLTHVARALSLPAGTRQTTYRHAQFVSQYLRHDAERSGKAIPRAQVIHWGIDADLFPYKADTIHRPRRFLYVGQLVPHKGVETAIRAMRILHEEHGQQSATLDLVGGSTRPEYVRQLRAMVDTSDLGHAIRFRGGVPRARLPQIYHEHDILIFPSIWAEPFSIALLEAMSAGLPVVATATGGSPEILESDVNSLVFRAGDPESCARQAHRLVTNRELYQRIRGNARKTVEQKFGFSAMVDEIEEALTRAISA